MATTKTTAKHKAGDTTEYRCKRAIRHNGQRYEKHAPIALTPDEAAPLLHGGHIDPPVEAA